MCDLCLRPPGGKFVVGAVRCLGTLISDTKVSPAHPSTDLTSILQKEALYCALGRCASRMKDVITFDEWLSTDLAAEVRSTNPRLARNPIYQGFPTKIQRSFPIIKRRIAWLIGKWISSECSTPNNPRVWEVLVYLLQDRGSGTDAVVRLTAAVALQECVDVCSQTYRPVAAPHAEP